MSICEQNRAALERYVCGLGSLEDFDEVHGRWCPECSSELKRAVRLRALLLEYSRDIRAESEGYLEEHPFRTGSTTRRSRFLQKPFLRWGAIAASLVLVFLVGRFLRPPSPSPMPEATTNAYLTNLVSESTRYEMRDYLEQVQLFLLTLTEEGTDCQTDQQAKRQIARRLIYQKRLLEPKLATEHFTDIRPVFDELELLLLTVADGKGCFKKEDYELWKKVIESRSTLMKLQLLQSRDRI
ncbi:MAG: hypothetical protein P8020_15845 [Acidobacteriota bacterium]|jgi:hypothetical protein